MTNYSSKYRFQVLNFSKGLESSRPSHPKLLSAQLKEILIIRIRKTMVIASEQSTQVKFVKWENDLLQQFRAINLTADESRMKWVTATVNKLHNFDTETCSVIFPSIGVTVGKTVQTEVPAHLRKLKHMWEAALTCRAVASSSTLTIPLSSNSCTHCAEDADAFLDHDELDLSQCALCLLTWHSSCCDRVRSALTSGSQQGYPPKLSSSSITLPHIFQRACGDAPAAASSSSVPVSSRDPLCVLCIGCGFSFESQTPASSKSGL